jgi:PhnB protein
MAEVKPNPDDFPQITTYLYSDGASDAIEFYCKVFGATERMRISAPNGKIGHAEIQIGDSVIMLSDEHPEMNVRSPKRLAALP